ncbi:restriction endonuclease subunit S [Candidatus Woesearchaeota archaeon]|nr:restriction endonuclease subunit S [Candidatus Woesearchaeota archaeon]
MALSISVQEIVKKNERNLLSKKDDWLRIPISEVAEILNGFAFKSSQFTTDKSKGMPLIRIRDIKDSVSNTYFNGDYLKEYVVINGDILIGMDGDFDIAIWQGEDALLNQRVCKITVNEKKFNKKFLYYLMPGYLQAIHNATSAVTVKHLSSRDIARIPLPNPPIKEQQQIVDEIEKQFTRLDTAVKDLKNVKEKLGVYRKSVLGSAFEKKWKYEESKNFFSWSNGKGLTQKQIKEGVYPVFGGNGINSYHQKYLTETESLVIGRVGAHCGNVHIAPSKSWITDNAIFSLEVSKDKILGFYMYYFRSKNLNSLAGGTGQPYVSQTVLNSIKIPIVDKEVQKSTLELIESRFSIIDKLEQSVDSALIKTELLRKSILKSAFEGKLVKNE